MIVGPAPRLRPRARAALAAAILCLSLGGCSAWPRRWGNRPCCIETKPIVRRQPIGWHLFDVTVISPVKRLFQVARVGRRMVGLPVRALNLQRGTVADDAFFTNRDPADLSPEEVRAGPTHPEDLVRPPFTITKTKTEGKTPGFFVTDARGARYLFKLDPVDAPELLSGAEVVSSKLLHALGYHVPSYEVALVRPDELRLSPDLPARSADGAPRPFGQEALDALVGPRVRDGTVRVAASKILDGEILGPAAFKRFRDCAEVRALNVAYAWLNNIDAKDHNSLLVWDGAKTVGYLIDFGTSLGADAGRAGPKGPCAGWLNLVDLQEASLKLVTLGLHRPPCDVPERPMSPAVGFFSTQVDPDAWKPYAPNLAFNEMNEDDARWMARRMSHLTRAHIDAAVSAGQYSDAADAAYLAETLESRRAAIVRRYLEE